MELARYLDELSTLVNIDCGTKTVAGVTQVASIICEKYRSLGWHAEQVDLGNQVGHGVFTTNKPHAKSYDVLLVGHLDTVFPEGTVAQRPLTHDEKNAYGPGVADMKGGILNILWAMRSLDKDVLNNMAIAITMNPDEETGSVHSKAWIASYAKKSRCVLVCEGARVDGSLVKARKGAAMYQLDFTGKASHAGNAPEKGRSAITELAHWVLALNQLAQPEQGTTVNIGTINGGDAANIVPDHAQAVVDVRFRCNDEYVRVNKAISEMVKQSFTPDIKIALKPLSLLPAMDPTAETETLMQHVEQCGDDVGIKVTWQSVGGGSDANHTAALGVPSLDGFGPVGGNFHTPEEYLDLDSVFPRIKLLARVISTLAPSR